MLLEHDGLSLSFGVRDESGGARVAKVAQGFFLLDVAVGVLSWVATGAAVGMRRSADLTWGALETGSHLTPWVRIFRCL